MRWYAELQKSTDDTMLGTGRGADFYLYNWCRIIPLFPRMLFNLSLLYLPGVNALLIYLCYEAGLDLHGVLMGLCIATWPRGLDFLQSSWYNT